ESSHATAPYPLPKSAEAISARLNAVRNSFDRSNTHALPADWSSCSLASVCLFAVLLETQYSTPMSEATADPRARTLITPQGPPHTGFCSRQIIAIPM